MLPGDKRDEIVLEVIFLSCLSGRKGLYRVLYTWYQAFFEKERSRVDSCRSIFHLEVTKKTSLIVLAVYRSAKQRAPGSW